LQPDDRRLGELARLAQFREFGLEVAEPVAQGGEFHFAIGKEALARGKMGEMLSFGAQPIPGFGPRRNQIRSRLLLAAGAQRHFHREARAQAVALRSDLIGGERKILFQRPAREPCRAAPECRQEKQPDEGRNQHSEHQEQQGLDHEMRRAPSCSSVIAGKAA